MMQRRIKNLQPKEEQIYYRWQEITGRNIGTHFLWLRSILVVGDAIIVWSNIELYSSSCRISESLPCISYFNLFIPYELLSTYILLILEIMSYEPRAIMIKIRDQVHDSWKSSFPS